MEFLVYTADPLNDNTTLASSVRGEDQEIGRIINQLEEMSVDRVVENTSINLFIDDISYDLEEEIVTAQIFKQTTPGKALHRLTDDGDKRTVREIISKNEDAFYEGVLGIKKVDREVNILVESNFGSYFANSCRGLELTPQYSGKTIQSIQDSETIGRTTLIFNEDSNLEASLFKPPGDEDIREESGFGNVDMLNKLASLFKISSAHRISLEIDRDLWLANVDVFDELIASGIVKTVKVDGTKENIVKLGEGGERAIRKKVSTTRDDEKAIEEAYNRLEE